MLKILKQLTKGVWKEDKTISKTVKKKPRKKKSSDKSREELIETLMKSIKRDFIKKGSKSLTVARIFNRVNVMRRSSKAVEQINLALKAHGFFTTPEITEQIDWKTKVYLTPYEVRVLGDLFDDERDLENYIYRNKLFKLFGLEEVDKQHSPDGTGDRLDFLGVNGKQQVIIELKKKDGGRSAVEQVFRYAGHLKRNGVTDMRKILVTGVQNIETALAITGHSEEERVNFEWYLYRYDKQSDSLDFVRVSEKDIENQLNNMPN